MVKVLGLCEKIDEESGKKESEDGADDDFADTMADAFLQAGEFFLVYLAFQLVDQHIEIAPLIAEHHADTEGIIDNKECQHNRNSERAGTQPFEVADRNKEGRRESGMHARHVSVRQGILYIEAVLPGIECELDDLGQEADRDGDEKHEVRLEQFHKRKLRMKKHIDMNSIP